MLLSPHLDDAALSCCGRLLRDEISCVITVFAGVPPAGTPASDWDRLTRAASASLRMVERRAEDAAAWGSVGQSFEQWDYSELDADRLDRRDLVRALEDATGGSDTVLIPAGIGRHPHHLLVRDAALEAIPAGATAILYGELPYAAFYGWPDGEPPNVDVEAYWRSDLATLPMGWTAGPSRINALDAEASAGKRLLAGYYATQFGAVSGGSLKLADRTELFSKEIEFEARWSG